MKFRITTTTEGFRLGIDEAPDWFSRALADGNAAVDDATKGTFLIKLPCGGWVIAGSGDLITFHGDDEGSPIDIIDGDSDISFELITS